MPNEYQKPRPSHFRGPELSEALLPNFRPHTSVLKLLLDGLHRNADAVAMIECDTGKSATFADLLQKSTSLAVGLRSVGVGPGDLVVFCCEKSIFAFSLVLATMFLGASAVILPFPCADRIHEIFKNLKIKALFYDKEYESSIQNSINQMTVEPSMEATIDDQHPLLASLLQPSKDFLLYQVKDNRKHIPLIIFTSGTTGHTKSTQITDIALQLTALFSKNYYLTCKSMFITVMMFGLSTLSTMVSCIHNGHRLYMTNIMNPKTHFEILEKYKIDRWSSSLCFTRFYINDPSYHEYDLTSVTNVRLGGQTVYGSVFQEFGNKILGGKALMTIRYGMTETGILAFWEGTSLHSNIKSGRVGTLAPGVEIKIVDECDSTVPTGCLGKIRAKSITMTPGYLDPPEGNAELFDKEGFFRTGDVGYFTDDGVLHHLGRECDLINYKGLKVSTIELEDCLMSHPDVEDATIVGTPHPTDGEHMTAFVVTKSKSRTTEIEIITYCNERVKRDEWKLRGGVIFLDSVPRTFAFKVNKNTLRSMIPISQIVEF